MRATVSVIIASLLITGISRAQAPATQPAPQGKLPFIAVDVKNKQIRVDCEVIGCTNPLELF